MKKQLRKVFIILMIWILVFGLVITTKTFADSLGLTVSIKTDKSSYSVNDDLFVTIKFNEKVFTSSFYLNYDSSILTYKGVNTSASITAKDCPNDNLVRVIYADVEGVGIKEFSFMFKVKAGLSTNSTFSLSTLTACKAGETKAYGQSSITGSNNKAKFTIGNNGTASGDSSSGSGTDSISNDKAISVQGKTNNGSVSSTSVKSTDKTAVKSSTMPQTGISDVYSILIVLFVIITIYLGINLFKIKSYFKY